MPLRLRRVWPGADGSRHGRGSLQRRRAQRIGEELRLRCGEKGRSAGRAYLRSRCSRRSSGASDHAGNERGELHCVELVDVTVVSNRNKSRNKQQWQGRPIDFVRRKRKRECWWKTWRIPYTPWPAGVGEKHSPKRRPWRAMSEVSEDLRC